MVEKSDGSSASYYVLPPGATQLQNLISYRNMNAQIGEIFRACYRYGLASHSDKLRDAKKIKYYAEAEIARLEALQQVITGDDKCVHGQSLGRTCLSCSTAVAKSLSKGDKIGGFCSHGFEPWQNCPKCNPRTIENHCKHGTHLQYHCKLCSSGV